MSEISEEAVDRDASNAAGSETRERITAPYPPPEHLLRDLGIAIERRGVDFRAELEVVPHLCSTPGGVRAGVVGTLLDVVAGGHAATLVAPSWIATCDMKLHLLRPCSSGILVARTSVLRSGRSTVVLEGVVTQRGRAEEPVALGAVTFAVLEARGELQQMDDGPSGREKLVRTEFATPSSGLDRPVGDRLGARLLDPELGEVELPIQPYSSNTLGALQGGALATLIDLSAEATGRALGDPSWITSDFTIHYLALSKVGPIRSRSRLIRRKPGGALLRVEVRDVGARDRLVSVASAEVGPA